MKILIIKPGTLGDIIMSTPIIKRLQEHHAGEEIWLLTTPAYEILFSGWTGLNIKATTRAGVFNTFKTLNWIWQNKFDRLYDLQSNDRTTLLSALSGIPIRAGNHPRFPYHLHPETKYEGECHSFERLNQILESADIIEAAPNPFLPVTDLVVNKISSWLKTNKLTNSTIVLIHAGSSHLHKHKRWPYYAELAKTLVHNNFDIIWIGSDDDATLNKQLSKDSGIDATNQFTVPELVELGKQATFAITNDSAPMHLLSCSGIPVYGLFGPTDPGRTHALGQKHRIISASGDLPLNDSVFVPADINIISCHSVMEFLNKEGLIT
ncbi:MAG: glycosyltransferase family 9 protein [Proteobacteria bacterium]|nr:glycosyltransferase family 9 protein [Pseudomonadota bacterium]